MGKMHLKNIPVPLRPYVPIIERWISFEGDPLGRLREAEADERALAELQAISSSWSREQEEAFNEWSEGGERSAFEWMCFHHFLEFLDALTICPDPGNPDPVQGYVDDLSRCGPKSKDAGRQWAARTLPDYGPTAMRAIPHLKKALSDEDVCVRVWAHYALALLDGDVERHRAAIESIGQRYGEPDARIPLEVEVALERLSRTPEWRARDAFSGFCITGGLENIRRLLPQVDVNEPDDDGARPLDLAVGNDKVDAVELLLAHGARPDVRGKFGDTPLHRAAPRRLGKRMIELLIQHGADVNARNDKGQTPLDCALEYDRTANVGLLRSLGGVQGANVADSDAAR